VRVQALVELVLELLVDEYDGWLDAAEEPPALPPLELPTAPRKIKRPLGG